MESRPLNGIFKRSGILLWAFFFCLYAFTCQRDVAWQDSGIFQWRILYRDLSGFFGLATAHVLYIKIAYFFTSLCGLLEIEAPLAANLFSAFCMAASVRILFNLSLELSGSRRGAFLAALTFGFSHMAWWLGTVAESYPLSLVFIGLEALFTVRILKRGPSKSLILALAACSTFGFDVHNLSLLSLPVTLAAIVFASAHAPDKRLADIAGDTPCGNDSARAFLSFASVMSFAICWLALSRETPSILGFDRQPFGSFLRDRLFGGYEGNVLGISGVPAGITLANFAIMALSFSSPCWIAGFAAASGRLRRSGGLIPLLRKAAAPKVAVAAIFAIHAIFLVRYRIADQALFLLPTLFFACALLSVLLAGTRVPALLALATPLCAVALPLAVNAVLHLPPLERSVMANRARLLPFRDEIRYWALPWKHDERSAEIFAKSAIMAMDMRDAGAALYADSTSAPPLMLRYGDSDSPGWSLFTPWNDSSRFSAKALAGETVFAVSPVLGYCPAQALESGNVLPLFPAASPVENSSPPK